jgi:hypothetical protein
MTRSPTARAVGHVVALTALLASCAGAFTGDVSVTDKWAEGGSISLDNGAWRVVFSKGDAAARVYDLAGGVKAEVMSLAPVGMDGGRAGGLTACSVLEGSPEQAQCRATFSAKGAPIEATFALNSRGAIRVEPSASLKAVAVCAAYRYGVLPSRLVDDDIYEAASYPKLTRLHLPSENLLMGLIEGGNDIVVLAWPSAEQSPTIVLSGPEKKRRIEALEVTLAGRELFIGAFSAPGIWYEKDLRPDYEERDASLDWTPPFEAIWKTQLTELGVPTTFRCAHERLKPWRPTIGFYTWPFFQENDRALLHLHKKLECEGKALIYALEGNEKTPYAFLTANLPPDVQQGMTELHAVMHYYVLDPNPVQGGFIMNAHCAGRDQLKLTTLTVGAQAREIEFLDTHIMDRVHECGVIAALHVQRSLTCMEDLGRRLDGWSKQEAGNTGLATFLRSLRDTLTAMHDEYLQRLGGESPQQLITRTQQVGERFKAVIRDDAGPELCPEILADINELNAVISLEEDQGRRFGTWSRKLFQQAAYECVGEPQAAEHAREIRGVLRDHLRYRQYEEPATAGTPASLLPGE